MFISPAYAQAAGSPSGSDIMTFLPMIAIVVVFYFLLIRPQQKRAKETKAMLSSLQKGDEVVTAGGVVGKISKLGTPLVALTIHEAEADRTLTLYQDARTKTVYVETTEQEPWYVLSSAAAKAL